MIGSVVGGRYRIVFNGEIYNYVELREELKALGATFATEGDTEAIVAGYHQWGQDVVHRLRGMFAFLIWDTQEKTVFGARDPFGIKPLFVTRLADGAVAFSSEKKALLELLGGSAAAGGVDAASLQHYLTLQYVPEPATLHRGIRRIESGTSFTVADGELRTKRYFHPTFPIRPVAKNEQQALYDRIADVLDRLVIELLEKETLDKAEVAEIFEALRRRPLRPAWTGSPTRNPSEIPPVDVPQAVKERASANGGAVVDEKPSEGGVILTPPGSGGDVHGDPGVSSDVD